MSSAALPNDIIRHLRRKVDRLASELSACRMELTCAEEIAADEASRYRETIERYGQPPEHLVAAIRDESLTDDSVALVELIGGGRIMALLDGAGREIDLYTEAEVWRHLNASHELYAHG